MGMGPGVVDHMVYYKPTANTNLTWVRNNHTYKFGGEMMVDAYKSSNYNLLHGLARIQPQRDVAFRR